MSLNATVVDLFVNPTTIIQKLMSIREVNMKRKLRMALPFDVNNFGANVDTFSYPGSHGSEELTCAASHGEDSFTCRY
jgi:hypothetical protein